MSEDEELEAKQRLVKWSLLMFTYVVLYLLLSFIYMDFDISHWYIGRYNLISTIFGRICLTVIVVFINGFYAIGYDYYQAGKEVVSMIKEFKK